MDREKDLPSTASLPQRVPTARVSQKQETKSLPQISKMDAGLQGFGPFSTAFVGHRQEAGLEVGQEDMSHWPYGMPALRCGGLAN